MATTRTFFTFSTEASEAGEVFDETFRSHAVVVLDSLRSSMTNDGWRCAECEPHSFYGVKVVVEDPLAGSVEMILQAAHHWLLTLSRKPTLWERLMGRRNDEVSDGLAEAVTRGLSLLNARSIRAFTREEFERPGEHNQW